MLGCQVPASYWQFMIWSNAGVTASIAYTDHATDITGPGIWAGLFVSIYMSNNALDLSLDLCQVIKIFYFFDAIFSLLKKDVIIKLVDQC